MDATKGYLDRDIKGKMWKIRTIDNLVTPHTGDLSDWEVRGISALIEGSLTSENDQYPKNIMYPNDAWEAVARFMSEQKRIREKTEHAYTVIIRTNGYTVVGYGRLEQENMVYAGKDGKKQTVPGAWQLKNLQVDPSSPD